MSEITLTQAYDTQMIRARKLIGMILDYENREGILCGQLRRELRSMRTMMQSAGIPWEALPQMPEKNDRVLDDLRRKNEAREAARLARLNGGL